MTYREWLDYIRAQVIKQLDVGAGMLVRIELGYAAGCAGEWRGVEACTCDPFVEKVERLEVADWLMGDEEGLA